MIDSLNWWFNLHRNSDLRSWMKDTYSSEELHRLTFEATDCSLIRIFNPMADQYVYNGKSHGTILKETTKRLYKRYHNDIWNICLGAGGYDPDSGLTGIKCLANLDLAFQVSEKESFEEFMVRNAIKYTAKRILEKEKYNKK